MNETPKLDDEIKTEISKKVEEKQKIAEAKEDYNAKKPSIKEGLEKAQKEREIVAESKEKYYNVKKPIIQDELFDVFMAREFAAEGKARYEKDIKPIIQKELNEVFDHKEKVNKEIEAGKVEYEAKKPGIQKEIAEKTSSK